MQKGFNSDVSFRGLTYHIQTEDWGKENPFLVSQIFLNGAVIRNIKIPYTKVIEHFQQDDVHAIRAALEAQHQSILDLLVSGQLI